MREPSPTSSGRDLGLGREAMSDYQPASVQLPVLSGSKSRPGTEDHDGHERIEAITVNMITSGTLDIAQISARLETRHIIINARIMVMLDAESRIEEDRHP